MDKFGLPYKEWNVAKQWYSIDDVSFIDKLVWVDFVYPAGDERHNGDVDPGEMVGRTTSSPPVTPSLSRCPAPSCPRALDVNGNGLMDDQAMLTTKAELRRLQCGQRALRGIL